MFNHLLPSNATPIEVAFDLTFAEQLNQIPIKNIWDQFSPDDCPEHLLPWLAWALSIDEWESDWSVEKKRAVIKASVEVHQKRGTPGSLIDDFASLDWQIEYLEWHEYNGCPHTFRASVVNPPESLSTSDIELIQRKIHRDKAARDYFEIEISQAATTGFVSAQIAGGLVENIITADIAVPIPQTSLNTGNIVFGEFYKEIGVTFQ